MFKSQKESRFRDLKMKMCFRVDFIMIATVTVFDYSSVKENYNAIMRIEVALPS